ncbi:MULTISPECIES: catechol 1,2-dioxygenase [unclassified Brevibacterium]|uniref:catechol 1,2-dioxygenase n=1 Tax=unclassified Brevibacterium TaxID=2614124 RepID=UPI0010F842FC|nr:MULTISPECIES: catechol 1,2-dioxygenase [unclassified Brevibacterium]MCM1013016.1 catechol 1,2-dioxygenase [Brevibacterium sp. XM4083]
MSENSFQSEVTAKAAESGANASARFRERQAQGGTAAVDQERVARLAGKAIKALNDLVVEEQLSYEEYNAFKAWLIKVGEDGEWPLFLDVWLEHSVEEVANADREGSKGTIEGPYYLGGSPELEWNGTIPMRDDEPGTPFVFKGQVTAVDGTPLPGAKLELWHADNLGFYSQFAPGLPEWNLRGTFTANDNGEYEIHTIRPAPYQIPTDGACGQLIAAAGWHAWRPAHLHFKVHAPEHQLITSQLYFPGDPHNDDDIASAVKPELLLDPQPNPDGEGEVTVYDFVLDPA